MFRWIALSSWETSGPTCPIQSHPAIHAFSGGSPCPDPLVARKTALPPRHILLQSYVPWITAAISGRPIGASAKNDPFGKNHYLLILQRECVNLFDRLKNY